MAIATRGHFFRILGSVMAVTGSALIAPTVASAFDLKDKVVTIYVAGGAGGGVDAYARVLAPFLGKYLPGQPAIKISNMPGGGGAQAVQYLYNVAPKDGTALGTTNAGPVARPLMERDIKVPYDLQKFRWIGSVTKGNTVCATWHASPVKSLADARQKVATIGTTGARSAPTRSALLMNTVLGTRFKPIAGYNGGTLLLAMERGEVDGMCSTLNSLRTTRPEWLRDKKLNILFHVAMKADGEYANLPVAYDLIDARQKQMMEFFLLPYEFNNPYYLPPGVPDAAVAQYRRAFDEAMKDKAYLAEAQKRKQDVTPESGEAVEKMVARMFAIPADIVDATVKAVNPAGRVENRKSK